MPIRRHRAACFRHDAPMLTGMPLTLRPLACAVALAISPLPVLAQTDALESDDGARDEATFSPVEPPLTLVITSEVQDAPLTVITDPRQPRQPVPAHDGADYLKTVTGFR